MKILLISPDDSIIGYGLRSVASVLKQDGFSVRMVFLPRDVEGYSLDAFRRCYSKSLLDQLQKLAEGADLIGISVMSNNVREAIQITEHLRGGGKRLVIWGGIHPTIRPEECLARADLVCVGEGEEAMVELARRLERGDGYRGIANIFCREEGKTVRTPLRPLVTDLDRIPYPDYELQDHFALYRGKIEPMTEDLLYHYFCHPSGHDRLPVYATTMSRGCPWTCSYCSNSALKNLYHESWKVRRRSVANFIGELKSVITRYPRIQWIKLQDDTFLDDDATLREFAAAYKEHIKLPLFVTGFQPPMATVEKIGVLVDAGMKRVRMGLQTGSMGTMRGIYKRPSSRQQLQKAFQAFHQFQGRIEPPSYDLILDNPWETDDDCLETLNLLMEIPKPYKLNLFTLTFFPGTELHGRAKAEGLLRDERSEIYERNYLAPKYSYVNYLIRIAQYAPRWFVRLLMRKQFRHRNLAFLPYVIHKSRLGKYLPSW